MRSEGLLEERPGQLQGRRATFEGLDGGGVS